MLWLSHHSVVWATELYLFERILKTFRLKNVFKRLLLTLYLLKVTMSSCNLIGQGGQARWREHWLYSLLKQRRESSQGHVGEGGCGVQGLEQRSSVLFSVLSWQTQKRRFQRADLPEEKKESHFHQNAHLCGFKVTSSPVELSRYHMYVLSMRAVEMLKNRKESRDWG